eukprot:m.126823 g.126823  ORF g.126823 m.126823 type:complete len:218 (-) comp22202_c0_seq2:2568-3221(-)
MAGPAADLDDFGDEEDGARKVLTSLQYAWVSEKAAPEVLQYETETVQQLLDMVADQDTQSREHASDTVSHRFFFNVYQMEIARIKFLIRSYLRTRLQKIEKYAMFILGDASLLSRLSEHELQYAQEYSENLSKHMTAAVLKDIPVNFAKLDSQTEKEDMVPKPNVDTHVFCLAKDNLGIVQVGVGEETSVQIDRGDLYILRYGVVAEFLRDGRVVLL